MTIGNIDIDPASRTGSPRQVLFTGLITNSPLRKKKGCAAAAAVKLMRKVQLILVFSKLLFLGGRGHSHLQTSKEPRLHSPGFSLIFMGGREWSSLSEILCIERDPNQCFSSFLV